MNSRDVQNERFMRMALRQAAMAADAGDVPVGAVITRDDIVLGQAHNQTELLKDPTAHAEMIAITQAAAAVGDWRLNGLTLYVTKEPCPMCGGAIALARISRVVFGASDPSVPFAAPPAVTVESGLLAGECAEILREFFRRLRASSSAASTGGGMPSVGQSEQFRGEI